MDSPERTTKPPAVKGSARPRIRSVTILLGVAGLVAAAMVFRNPWFRGNEGVVAEGKVYRSAQPTHDWESIIARRGLRSVVNLRGGSSKDPWYELEVEKTREGGVDFYDLPMSATERPTREQLLQLIDLLGRCRYPLLIHCKSGSDRTGLVSGLYRLTQEGQPPDVAGREFSVYYGHVPLLRTKLLHAPFDEYSDWLDARKLPHTPARFRGWVESEYRAVDPFRPIEPIATGPRDRGKSRATAFKDRVPRR